MTTARESRTLGDAIRRRRLELGWTQETLVERVADLGGDLRQSDVSRIERGKVALPRRDRLERIAAALELSLGELLSRSGWAGAEGAFDRAPEPEAARQAVPVTPESAQSATAPDRSVAPPPVLSPRLRDAIREARDLEAWSADVLRRTASTLERANRPLAGQAAPSSRP